MATAKVNVVNLFKASACLGKIDPKVGMQTNRGRIVRVSGDLCELASGDHNKIHPDARFKDYPDKLDVLYSHATGVWAFPTGDGAFYLGRSGLFPNGTPEVPGTGSAIMLDGGRTILSFGR